MNKSTANLILGFVFACFCILLLLNYYFTGLFIIRTLLFVSEAALIGGIADWFAVTALFRKPLGFPFHTAIIPRNRGKFIESMANMVQRDLLSIESIMKLLDKMNVVNLLIVWVENKRGRTFFSHILTKYVQMAVNELDPQELAIYLEKLLKDHVDQLPLNIQINNFMRWAAQKGEQDRWIEYLLSVLAAVVKKDNTRLYIHKLVQEVLDEKMKNSNIFLKGFLKLGGLTNSINPVEAAQSLHEELVDFLESLKETEHPIRIYINEMLHELANNLEHRSSWIEAIEAWKKGIMDQIHLQDLIEQAVVSAIEFINRAPSDLDGSLLEKTLSFPGSNPVGETNPPSPVIEWLAHQLEKYWDRFRQDQEMKNWLEKYMKEVLISIIDKEHYLVGQLVVETLDTFTNKALNQFIEDKVGNDLQWIRINGSLVGSIVGLLIFLFIDLFYSPVIAPIIRGWFM